MPNNILNVYEKIAEKYDEALWDDMPYNNQIDYFLSLLKHLEMFKGFSEILKDDGIIFIILQKGNGEKYVQEPLETSITEFVNFYEKDEIEDLFRQCNLEMISVEEIRDDAEFELGNEQLVYYLKRGLL